MPPLQARGRLLRFRWHVQYNINRPADALLRMSYFSCTFGTGTSLAGRLDTVIAEIAPQGVRTDAVRLQGPSARLSTYGNNKIIANQIVCDPLNGSWLAIIGTPLLRLGSDQKANELLKSFLSSPEQVLRERLDGHFAIICYDAQKNALTAATDFNNTIPIFYSTGASELLLSSHELALARVSSAKIDSQGFSQVIQTGVTWGTATRFHGIQKMLPCQLLRVTCDQKLSFLQYWHPSNEALWSGNLDAQMERWLLLLRQSVSLFYECSDHAPALADFTAGEDARLIVAQCHALGMQFKAYVGGSCNAKDVLVAKTAAAQTGFELVHRVYKQISSEELQTSGVGVVVQMDAYRDMFQAFQDFATNEANPLDTTRTVKFGGIPGGEAFRGSYYLRGKALFPLRHCKLDHRFFTRMKYLLDFQPGLTRQSDSAFLEQCFQLVEESLEDVSGFPLGTQIDHVLRMFQTCCYGLKYRNPAYLPFTTGALTRSIYGLSPRYKQGGRLTKACTELLWPELARVKTQNGVPTIRRTWFRQHLFLPEYLAAAKRICRGALQRYYKLGAPAKIGYSYALNRGVIDTILNQRPFAAWFASPSTMLTGSQYQASTLEAILKEARHGSCRSIPILGRILSQEIALRWVYD